MSVRVDSVLTAALVLLAATIACPAQLSVKPSRTGHLPVYIEDSPAAQELVDEARSLRDDNRVAEAAGLLHRVVKEYANKLVRIEDHLYTEAVLWVRTKLRADDELLAGYRQLFEPTAQRQLALGLSPRIDPHRLEQVLGRFALTRSGLDAGLALASCYLERADPTAALSVLDELQDHPDIEANGRRYHSLQAIAGMLAADSERLDHHRRELVNGRFDAAAASIRSLSNRLHPPLRLKRQADTFLMDAGQLPDLSSGPLWTVEVSTALSHLAGRGVVRRQLTPRGTGGMPTMFPVIPTIGAELLYINDGDRIHALDRSSGRAIWVFDWAARQPRDELTAAVKFAQVLPDQRGVLLVGDRVTAVVGHASVWPGRVNRSDTKTTMVAIDRNTGRLLWQTDPGQIDRSFTKAYFHGTPLPGYGRVYALVRRNQMSGYQVAFLVALDAATGELLWRRHLASAVTARGRVIAAPTHMIAHQGRLYVSDNLGAVASVDGRTGARHWVRLLLDADVQLRRGIQSGGIRSVYGDGRPVLVDAGLVVTATYTSGPVLLLDPDTGRTIRALDDEHWESVMSVARAGNDVLGLGQVITLFDGATLEPKWTYRVTRGKRVAEVGLTAVTDRFVTISTNDRVVVLNSLNGTVHLEVESDEGGNVLALQQQLVVAGANGVRSYMDWQRAYDNLVEQARQDPFDPGPGLSLAHLALSRGRSDAALEGADRALAALREWSGSAGAVSEPDRQNMVFEHLLAFAGPDRGAGVELRRALFDRIATMTEDPRQEVAYHLTLGQLLEQTDEARDAVAHYQAVLLDPILAKQLYQWDRKHAIYRLAGLEAKRRLIDMTRAHGRLVYARFDLIATQRLAELTQAEPVDAEALIELARQYPVSSAASRALYEAALRLATGGDRRSAISQLRRSYQRCDDPALRPRIAGRLAEMYQNTDRPQRAVQWLKRIGREQEGIEPIRNGVPVSIDQWLDDLAGLGSTHEGLPTLSLPLGEPSQRAGKLLTPTGGPQAGPPRDRVLTRTATGVRMFAGSGLEPIWDALVPAEDAQLLALDEEQVLLWSPDTGALEALDGSTGDPVWPRVDTQAMVEELGNPGVRDALRPADLKEFMQMIGAERIQFRGGRPVLARQRVEPGLLTAVGENAVCLADNTGRAAAIDRHTGEPLWRVMCPIEHVVLVAVGDGAVALAGRNGVGTDAVSGAVIVLDVLTGESRFPVIEDRDPPRWVGFSDGHLIIATKRQVTAHRMVDGEVAWRITVAGTVFTGHGRASANLILLVAQSAGNTAGLVVIDAQNGQIVNRLALQSFGGPSSVQTAYVDGQWLVMTPSGLLAIGPTGELSWRDAISLHAKRFVWQLVGDEHVAVLVEADTDPDAVPQRYYQLYLLDRSTGSIVAEHGVGPFSEPVADANGAFVNNALVFTAGKRTIVIGGATGGP